MQDLENKLNLADFLMLIRKYPVAMSLHMKRCRDSDIDQLRDIFVQEDDFQNQAYLKIIEAYQSEIVSQLAFLQGATESLKKTRNELGSQLTEEQIKLLKWQAKLEKNEQKNYINKSLQDTMAQLIQDGNIKEADKMRVEFKMSDRKYAWIRVMSHSQANHWKELNLFSMNKKIPIGFEPFVDVCLKYGSKNEAQKYVSKVKEDNKITYLLKCDMLDEAAKVAQEQRNIMGLRQVVANCGPQHQTLKKKILTTLSELSAK